MALGLTNNNNNNNKTWTKQNKNKNKNKNFATMLYKFLSLGWSELSDYNLHILVKKKFPVELLGCQRWPRTSLADITIWYPFFRVSNMNETAENTEL